MPGDQSENKGMGMTECPRALWAEVICELSIKFWEWDEKKVVGLDFGGCKSK